MAFRGKNTLMHTGKLMYERLKYQVEAYPENNGMGPNMIKNTNFAEMNYYGRVDRQGRAIYPIESKMKVLNVGKDTEKLVSPVVSLIHYRMKNNIDFKMMAGEYSPTIPAIAALQPIRAYESPLVQYKDYLDTIVYNFNESEIPKIGSHNIMNYKSYVKYFMKFLKKEYFGKPICFTGWVKSSLNSIYNTGLAIGIDKHPFDVDRTKERYINSPEFTYYKYVAMNMGFSIMHNAPWCLIADLGSPAVAQYWTTLGVSGVTTYLEDNFELTSPLDLNLIKNKINYYYNAFVTLNEYERVLSASCKKTHVKYKYRKKVDTWTSRTRTLNKNSVKENTWVSIYAHIRNIEERNLFNDNELNSMINIAKSEILLNTTLDNSMAIGYIDGRFVSMAPRKPWGFNHRKQRRKQRKKIQLERELSGETSNTGGSSGGSSGGY